MGYSVSGVKEGLGTNHACACVDLINVDGGDVGEASTGVNIAWTIGLCWLANVESSGGGCENLGVSDR